MRAVTAVLVLAACGDNRTGAADAAVATGDCTVMFEGNFVEASSSPDNCASTTTDANGAVLSFMVPSATLQTSLAVTIGLGMPTTGNYSSQTTTSWQATATQVVGGFHCFYTAGSSASPHGSFALVIDSLADGTAHGKLSILQYVLAESFAMCGPGDNEAVTLTF